jgi:hypothetical protein
LRTRPRLCPTRRTISLIGTPCLRMASSWKELIDARATAGTPLSYRSFEASDVEMFPPTPSPDDGVELSLLMPRNGWAVHPVDPRAEVFAGTRSHL